MNFIKKKYKITNMYDKKNKVAMYPGSFDPFHNGHLNILVKALNIFDFIYIVITKNINKNISPDLKSRIEKIKEMTKDLSNIEIVTNDKLLTIDFAKEMNIKFIVRGVRDIETFKNEVDYIDANRTLSSDIETILLVSDMDKRQLSSSIIKEIEFYKNQK
ncbi:phosphopantetheine adenylyltransferase [Spiroplasma litorale]|uniref:Phosphopantetheine adenylyltransferase n=1 Tax=Spiroplasma litorale TaxID=216942 RepID=A0A0K1W0U8_9MOLU|nr:pantetheine-phosphate adenylyltransferase [Spiroplasma litorale]AKX33801.1 phosphopantetheine adenylyltransferase [Spiroplasma litorale]